jgi:hypothetical protein
MSTLVAYSDQAEVGFNAGREPGRNLAQSSGRKVCMQATGSHSFNRAGGLSIRARKLHIGTSIIYQSFRPHTESYDLPR